MEQIPYPLRTERLVLRRFEPTDLDAYYAYQSLPETARYLLGDARSLAECMERVGKFSQQKFSQEGDWASFAVELAEQPGLLGEIALKWGTGGDAEHGYVGEIGWTLTPQAQGKGYATEAARAVLELAFGQLGFHRLHARLDAANDGSRKICERLGMRAEGLFQQNWFLKGEWTSEAVYAILRSEWRAQQ
ncbi:GNAT family N-acetyltransferase [Psychromicrobium lacuslunae]|uniref:GCN5 family acetyltransferase n=1 Tax=Psychromicrobium lacuslunae TaxID=1618207 RepID=A0A0D4BZZ8_9MICC|nr:GNAT family N-acetyltransferase [Psychromicrobium lacuslunae]AJT41899.1 GCN5 family acetyltransferase [Psychromicrobium lacuslunae]